MRDHNGMSYVARKPCDCMVAAMLDSPSNARNTAKEVAGWIAHGLKHVPNRVVSEEFVGIMCPHEPRKVVTMPLFEVEKGKQEAARQYVEAEQGALEV